MSARIEYQRNGPYVEELTYTATSKNSPAIMHQFEPYRWLSVSVDDGNVVNDGEETESVTVEVINGLQAVRGNIDPDVLQYDGGVALEIDDAEMTKTLTDGRVVFDVTTEKSAGNSIDIVAKSLSNNIAKSDRADIKVIQ